jgi:hypothetical protein
MTDTLEARHSRRWWISAAVLSAILLAAAVFALQKRAQAEATGGDSIQFPHNKHLAAGVPCLFCHPGALNGTVASIPSVQKCVGCHSNIQVTSQAGQAAVGQLMAVWEAGQPLVWPRVVDLPDFVHFAHSPHIAAGKNCETCHGDVSQMTMAHVAYRINMGFCLENCHRHANAAKRARLMSCATCHQ